MLTVNLSPMRVQRQSFGMKMDPKLIGAVQETLELFRNPKTLDVVIHNEGKSFGFFEE